MTKQPDAPDIPPEIYRLRYFQTTTDEDEDGPRFFVEAVSLEEWLRDTAEDLESQAEAHGTDGDELTAAGMYGAAHVLTTMADQVALLPHAHEFEDGDE